VAARPLHPAGCVQFGKESNEHAESLPSTANDGKPGCIAASGTPGSVVELSTGKIADQPTHSLSRVSKPARLGGILSRGGRRGAGSVPGGLKGLFL